MTAPEPTAAALRAWLLDDALPLWWERGADRRNGGFHDALALDGRPVDRPKRARVQARQAYVYARAATLGWDGPWREAVEHALAAFQERFLRPDGLYGPRVAPGGGPLEGAPELYDQAFGLFAYAEASRAMADRLELRTRGHDLLDAVEARFANPAGGFIEPGQPHPCNANPHMHLLEAALAWEAAGADPRWRDLSDRLATLALDRFFDPERGVIREHYTCDWTPAPGLAGRLVEPGHQFEWAWLLDRWGEARGRADAREAARRLYAAGRAAVDPVRRVAVNAVLDDGSVRDADARLWPQTEWIKAAVRVSGNAVEVDAAVRALTPYLAVPTLGLWRDRRRASGGFVDEPAPASSFYHVVGAILELDGASTTLRDQAPPGDSRAP